MRYTMLPIAVATLAACPVSAQDPAVAERERMVVAQVEARGIRHPGVLRAMRATPRHLFVPPDLRRAAYEDHPLPIGHGATISQPYIVALMTELLAPEPRHRVLEIGAGSGYQAAILSHLVSEVYTIEISPELAATASARLRGLGYRNVTVREGDGYKGWPERAPFHRIVLTAAPVDIPSALLDQLARGGRLVAPVGPLAAQDLTVIDKGLDGRLHRRSAGSVLFLPMKGPGRN